jgi:hypothetical protein
MSRSFIEFSPRHWGGIAFEGFRAYDRTLDHQFGLTIMMRGWFL